MRNAAVTDGDFKTGMCQNLYIYAYIVIVKLLLNHMITHTDPELDLCYSDTHTCCVIWSISNIVTGLCPQEVNYYDTPAVWLAADKQCDCETTLLQNNGIAKVKINTACLNCGSPNEPSARGLTSVTSDDERYLQTFNLIHVVRFGIKSILPCKTLVLQWICTWF